MPLHPSIAQTRSGHARTYSRSVVNPSGSVVNLPPPRTVSSPAMTSIVAERLCGSIPMTTRSDCTMSSSAARTGVVVEQGGHRYFELSKPLLILSPLRRHPSRASHERATRPVVGSRCGSDDPGTWTEPCQTPVLGLSLIHISEPTRLGMISYAVFCLKKKKKKNKKKKNTKII